MKHETKSNAVFQASIVGNTTVSTVHTAWIIGDVVIESTRQHVAVLPTAPVRQPARCA